MENQTPRTDKVFRKKINRNKGYYREIGVFIVSERTQEEEHEEGEDEDVNRSEAHIPFKSYTLYQERNERNENEDREILGFYERDAK